MRREGGRILVGLWVAALLFASAGVGLCQGNLLLNPGFEDWTGGEPDHWTADDSITVAQHSDTVHGGSYSAKVTLLTQDQDRADFCADTVTVSPGVEHSLCFWVFDNDTSGRARPFIWWYRSDGSHIANHWGGTYSSDTTAWQQVITTDSAPAEAGKAVAGLRFYDIAASWTGEALFWVDDAYFTEGVGVSETRDESRATSPITLQVSPNPFTSRCLVEYDLTDPSPVSLVIYDAAGRRLFTLFDGRREAGHNSFCWEPSRHRLPPGYYFLRLEALQLSRIDKVVVLR